MGIHVAVLMRHWVMRKFAAENYFNLRTAAGGTNLIPFSMSSPFVFLMMLTTAVVPYSQTEATSVISSNFVLVF